MAGVLVRRLRPPTKIAVGLAATALTLGLISCSAAEQPIATTERSAHPTSTTLPGGAVSLTSLGFRHGPIADVFVPKGAEISYRVDQPNVVTVIFAEPDGAELVRFYSASLPARGFVITGFSEDSLTFSRPGWEGSFTSTREVSGLTLRRVA